MKQILTTDSFDDWFTTLRDIRAKVRIQARIDRAGLGNFGDSEPVGEGVSEMRIHFGPGYRVYFVQRGLEVVILLAGGDKSPQSKDIKRALELARRLCEWSMKAIKLRPWDSAEHLKTEEEMVLYLEACLEEGDAALIAHALGVIAKARGMTQLARDTGLSRESLYKALSGEGNPEFATVMKVVKALGFQLHAAAAP